MSKVLYRVQVQEHTVTKDGKLRQRWVDVKTNLSAGAATEELRQFEQAQRNFRGKRLKYRKLRQARAMEADHARA